MAKNRVKQRKNRKNKHSQMSSLSPLIIHNGATGATGATGTSDESDNESNESCEFYDDGRCLIGMDTDFCNKSCAFCSNRSGSTPPYGSKYMRGGRL